MFFKNSSKAKESYKSDPLWAVVLSQLKSQTLGLTPFFRAGEIEASWQNDPLVGYQRFETILSQIEDSYNLNNLLILKRSRLRNASLAQIVEDISENYTRRFSSLASCKVLLLVENNLPLIKTHPAVVMQIADCLIRATQRLSAESGSRLLIRQNAAERGRPGEIGVRFECADLQFGVDGKRIKQSLTKFKLGKYADCVNDFGIDICAAFHLASQLGASINFDFSKTDTVSFTLDFWFERSDEAPRTEPAAGDFYLYSRGGPAAAWLNQVAAFHGVNLCRCADLKDLPSNARLVYDALAEDAAGQLDREAGLLPASAVIVVSGRALAAVRNAGGGRFKQLLTMPLASTKLLRALFAPPPEESAAGAKQEMAARPLKVLVVDDTETARITIQDYLESKGHLVVEACDGSEFIERIKRGEVYDLAICDLNMCHIDGISAVRMVREFEKNSGGNLKVALMTAFKATEQEDLSSIGVSAIMHKPVRPSDLDKLLAELF